MLAHEALPNPPPATQSRTTRPRRMAAAARATRFPLYDFPAKRVIHHLALETPVRTSCIARPGGAAKRVRAGVFHRRTGGTGRCRSGGVSVVVAVRSAGARLIQNVAGRCGWTSRGPAGTGRGLGLAGARYKNKAAYACVAVEFDVDQDISLRRVWCAADAGLVINPGRRAQSVEGRDRPCRQHDAERTSDAGWRWDHLAGLGPLSDHAVFRSAGDRRGIIDNPDLPTLGMGECTFGPTAAAIGNAVAHALGARIRDLPLTRERIAAALVR